MAVFGLTSVSLESDTVGVSRVFAFHMGQMEEAEDQWARDDLQGLSHSYSGGGSSLSTA